MAKSGGNIQEAVRILLAADDEASKKFQDVGDSAEAFSKRLKALENSDPLKRLLEPAAQIAGKFTIAGVAVKAFQQIVAGAGGTFDNELTKKVDEAAERLFAFTDGLGDAFKQASKVLPEESWLSKMLSKGGSFFAEGPRGAASMLGANLRDIGAHLSGKDQEAPDLIDVRASTKGMTRKAQIEWVQRKRKELMDEEQAITKGGGILSQNEKNKLAHLNRATASLNQQAAYLGQTNPEEMKKGIFGAGPKQNIVGPEERALQGKVAKIFGGAFKQHYVDKFGQPNIGIPEGLGGYIGKRADKNAKAKMDEFNRDEDARRAIIDRNKTAKERRDEELAEAKRLFPKGGDALDREKAAIQKRFEDATKGPEPEKAKRLGENAAIISRFGGGFAGGKDIQQRQLDVMQQIGGRLDWFKQRAEKQKQQRADNAGNRRVEFVPGLGF